VSMQARDGGYYHEQQTDRSQQESPHGKPRMEAGVIVPGNSGREHPEDRGGENAIAAVARRWDNPTAASCFQLLGRLLRGIRSCSSSLHGPNSISTGACSASTCASIPPSG